MTGLPVGSVLPAVTVLSEADPGPTGSCSAVLPVLVCIPSRGTRCLGALKYALKEIQKGKCCCVSVEEDEVIDFPLLQPS